MNQINSQEANAIRAKIETNSVKNYLYCVILILRVRQNKY